MQLAVSKQVGLFLSPAIFLWCSCDAAAFARCYFAMPPQNIDSYAQLCWEVELEKVVVSCSVRGRLGSLLVCFCLLFAARGVVSVGECCAATSAGSLRLCLRSCWGGRARACMLSALFLSSFLSRLVCPPLPLLASWCCPLPPPLFPSLCSSLHRYLGMIAWS